MKTLEKLSPLALLLLRLGLGVIFAYHGFPKLFGNTHAAMQGFERMGFPGFFVYVAGVIEFFGGLLLIAGLFTRLAGLLLAGEMLVVLWRVEGLFSHPKAVSHYEFPLALGVGAFALAAIGAGAFSLDHLIYGSGGKSPRRSKGKA